MINRELGKKIALCEEFVNRWRTKKKLFSAGPADPLRRVFLR
jgi:hypothetical protein